jgi:hypothetical protein
MAALQMQVRTVSTTQLGRMGLMRGGLIFCDILMFCFFQGDLKLARKDFIDLVL